MPLKEKKQRVFQGNDCQNSYDCSVDYHSRKTNKMGIGFKSYSL